jgi:precorrin-3B C17-methyltransferase
MSDTSTPSRPGGRIMLVGLGPGSHEHLTARARAAIAEADTIIGYVTYIRLVADLLEGKEVIKKSMTEELDRAIEAFERARQGKKVALISSGDAGVYGMAGPTFEVLFQAGWTPDSDIEVEIIPGASALNTCAALVGAPLTHDFCAISLSDLLTPWPTIARRLDAVAAADFVVALYNPKSGRRTGQIVEAQRLFLRHRRPDTPVAIVKSAYRPKQRIEFTTLEKMTEADIGMLSTVLIGNSNTFIQHGLMVTPRGYATSTTWKAAPPVRASRPAARCPPASRLARQPACQRPQRRRSWPPNTACPRTTSPPCWPRPLDATQGDDGMSEAVKPRIGAYRRHLLVCTGPRCAADGQAQALFDSLGAHFKAAGLDQGRSPRQAQPRRLLRRLQGRPHPVRAAGRHLVLRRHRRGDGAHRHRTPGGRRAGARPCLPSGRSPRLSP